MTQTKTFSKKQIATVKWYDVAGKCLQCIRYRKPCQFFYLQWCILTNGSIRNMCEGDVNKQNVKICMIFQTFPSNVFSALWAGRMNVRTWKNGCLFRPGKDATTNYRTHQTSRSNWVVGAITLYHHTLPSDCFSRPFWWCAPEAPRVSMHPMLHTSVAAHWTVVNPNDCTVLFCPRLAPNKRRRIHPGEIAMLQVELGEYMVNSWTGFRFYRILPCFFFAVHVRMWHDFGQGSKEFTPWGDKSAMSMW